MKPRQIPVVVLFVVLVILTATSSALAQSPGAIVTPFPVSQGAPLRVCAESPQVVWFTLPAQNSLGRLTLTSGVSQVDTFPIPTPTSEPYAIACSGGSVWLTERAGNKIASFNSAATTWIEYTIPTGGSEPTGLDVQPGNPTVVWFVERAGNKVGRLNVPQQGAATFDEYRAPVNGMQLEDVSLSAAGYVWFTAPGTRQIGRFNVSVWPTADAFALVYTGASSQPWRIAVGGTAQPWFTDRAGNRLGQYAPGTLALVNWVTLPTPNSQPTAIEALPGNVWFTEQAAQRAGRLEPPGTSVRQLFLPGSTLTDLSLDAGGCVWLADNAQSELLRWCSPYFRYIYLPRVLR